MATRDPIPIRRAERRDLPVLGRLGASLVRDHYAFDPRRFLQPRPRLEDGYAHFLGTQIDDEDAAVFVAERDGAVVGYAYARIEPLSWQELRDVAGFIHDVVVAPGARGSGVGTRLIEAAAAWVAERGVPRLMLGTAEKNRDAQRLFERLGFRRTMIEMTREAKRPPKAGATSRRRRR